MISIIKSVLTSISDFFVSVGTARAAAEMARMQYTHPAFYEHIKKMYIADTKND